MASLDLEHHTVVLGRTRSGKTYFFREAIYKATRKRVVFLNTQREAGFGPQVTHWRADLLAQPGSKVNLCGPRPSTNEAEKGRSAALLAAVVDDLIRIGEKARNGDSCQVICAVDEAHLFAPKHSSDDPLSLLATNGASYGIRFVAITQRPALLSHTVLSQATVHVLFDLDDYEAPYLDQYAVPYYCRAWASDPLPGDAPGTPNRCFAVRQGKTWSLCDPV